MQPLVNTCMATLSEGSDASDDLVCPFCDPCCPVYTASHLIMRRREKKIMKLSYDITMLTSRPRGFSLIRSYTSVSGAEGHGF